MSRAEIKDVHIKLHVPEVEEPMSTALRVALYSAG